LPSIFDRWPFSRQFLVIGDAFGISIPSLSDLGKILCIGLLALISMEIIKVIIRGKVEVGKKTNP